MYIIVGLGNPGKEYENTRHNIGFDVIEKIAERADIRIAEKKHRALIGKGMLSGEKVLLAKPQTYMNLSGESIRELVDYYGVDDTGELIIIADDVSLPPGKIRLRGQGSAGGHNGLKSIIAHLGHDTFLRVKMGVGEKPPGYDLADYVLGHFSKEERSIMDEAAERAAEAVSVILTQGLEKAMNRFN